MYIIHETEFLMYMIGKMVSYLHDFGLLLYYLCKYNNYKNRLSPSTTCFNLYNSSSGHYKNFIKITRKFFIIIIIMFTQIKI